MMSPALKEYLDDEEIQYDTIAHPVDYTAQEIAGAIHIPGKRMVKAVILKADDQYIMCVLPAIHLIDLDKLKNLSNTKSIRLADEAEIAKLFPEYEVGAEPPFGHLYGLKVYCDKSLEDEDEIVCNAGTHTDVFRMKFADYRRLANPIVTDFGRHI